MVAKTNKGNAGSISVKDFKLKFVRTFLSEYWGEERVLDQDTRGALFLSLCRRVGQVLFHAPLTTISSFVIVTASLLMLSCLVLFDFNLTRLLDEVKGSHEGLVYLSSDADEKVQQEVREVLQKQYQVQNIIFINKSDALETFKESLEDSASILEGLTDNPLPHSYEFTVPYDVQQFDAQGLKQNFPEVEEVVLGAPWVDTAEQLRGGIQQMSLIVLIVVLAVVVFIVSNVVRLLLYVHRDEIEIMQLVGAPPYRVYIPYILGSSVQGFFGGIAALCATYLLYNYFMLPLNQKLVLGLSYNTFEFFPFSYLLAISSIGILLCSLGAWFAVRKWSR